MDDDAMISPTSSSHCSSRRMLALEIARDMVDDGSSGRSCSARREPKMAISRSRGNGFGPKIVCGICSQMKTLICQLEHGMDRSKTALHTLATVPFLPLVVFLVPPPFFFFPPDSQRPLPKYIRSFLGGL